MSRAPELQKRLDAAQGRTPCDWSLRNVDFLDVFSCKWRRGDISVADGVIVGLEAGLKAKRSIEGTGKFLVPGFIDAHVHVESSLLLPSRFQDAVLPRGTTSAICDPHEIANVVGVKGISYFLEEASRLSLDLWVMLSSCVPATSMETNGGGTLSAADLLPLSTHPRALGLAEMMNVPGVLAGDPETLEKLRAFTGRPLDGHAPLLRGQALSAYASAGISSCHESSELEEAREKLTKGISVWIREGSVAKDLRALAPLLDLSTSTSVGFCTDDRNPYDIATEGHIDHLVRGAIRLGVAPEVAYRSASWSIARHYGLTNGAQRFGAVAPGYQADLVLLDDPGKVEIGSVFKSGVLSTELPAAKPLYPAELARTMKASVPEASLFEGPSGRVNVIRIEPGKIITGWEVRDHGEKGVARLSVLERHGKGLKPANGYVSGFGQGFRGAIASSVGHDSHNLIVAGDRVDDMRAAVAALITAGGGFSVARDGKILSLLPLPVGGLMSALPPEELKNAIIDLRQASRAVACELHEPFLQLAFLSLPVIPALKLTDRGLVDVKAFKIIDVRSA